MHHKLKEIAAMYKYYKGCKILTEITKQKKKYESLEPGAWSDNSER